MSEYQTFEQRQIEAKINAAEARADEAERRAEAAAAELTKVKRDIGWMMEHGLIRDIIFMSDSIPAGEQPYSMAPDPEDTDRLRWLNEFGRVSIGDGVFTVAFPHCGDVGNETLPTPYNIRHLLDLCRIHFSRSLVTRGNESDPGTAVTRESGAGPGTLVA